VLKVNKTRIAVVSTDGTHVDDHFGRAKRFFIFDVDEQMTLVEERNTEPLSADDPEHAFDTDKFGRISEQLKDCRKVYMTKIGDKPSAKLKELGVEPVIYEGAIADIAT
jgi:predicted Fe-Mo cluster-binding NifX family protein